jgi:hypothetical protein
MKAGPYRSEVLQRHGFLVPDVFGFPELPGHKSFPRAWQHWVGPSEADRAGIAADLTISGGRLLKLANAGTRSPYIPDLLPQPV